MSTNRKRGESVTKKDKKELFVIIASSAYKNLNLKTIIIVSTILNVAAITVQTILLLMAWR